MPPRGWSESALLADYVLALSDYPEAVLEEAARSVMVNRTRNSWPLPGEFREACEALGGKDAGAEEVDPAHLDRMQRTNKAHDYLQGLLHPKDADGNDLYEGTISHAIFRCHRLRELKAWILELAMGNLRAGEEPHVPESAIREKIADLDAEAEQADAYRAPHNPGRDDHSQIGNLVRRAVNPLRVRNAASERHVEAAKSAEPASDEDENIKRSAPGDLEYSHTDPEPSGMEEPPPATSEDEYGNASRETVG